MDEFPSNSHQKKPAKKAESKETEKLEKIVEGSVVQRKRSLGKRFSETFIGGDAKSVWSYVLFDVLIPASKDMVADAMSTGVERMLFGESRVSSRRSRGGNGYVNYSRFSSGGRREREEPRGISRRARASHDFNEIILETRSEAENVIDRLFDQVSQFEMATVGDLYDLVGINSNYTDNKWGWTDLRGAGVTRVRGGYLLELPRPEPLD